MKNHVYFIECNGSIKIGRATDVARRMQTLKTGNPHKMHLLGSLPKGDLEKKIHDRLHEHRIVGEWFKDCRQVREFIAHLMKFGEFPAPSRAPAGPRPDTEIRRAQVTRLRSILDRLTAVFDKPFPENKRHEAGAIMDVALLEFDRVKEAYERRYPDIERMLASGDHVVNEAATAWSAL